MKIRTEDDLEEFADDPAVQAYFQGERFVTNAEDIGEGEEDEAEEAESEE